VTDAYIGLGPNFVLVVGWVGLGQSADEFGRIGSHKMDLSLNPSPDRVRPGGDDQLSVHRRYSLHVS